MDQRGGCCIARYAGGSYDKVDRIMRKFRPIAPRPASGSGSGSSSSTRTEYSCASFRKRRRASKGTVDNNTRRRKSSADSGRGRVLKTLSLLRETPEVIEGPKRKSFGGNGSEREIPAADRFILGDPVTEVARRVVLWSWVKVECVTETWAVGSHAYGNLGSTDEERVRRLDVDTCPGFVSDGMNRVRWMNREYRRMVTGEGTAVEVVAWVVMNEGVELPAAAAAFTCRVKVVTWEKQKSCKTVPCDVWRMDCGGFSWRLDTRAALSLALSS